MVGSQTQDADAQGIRANKMALVERLADDLAHEIKNPLHSMVINLEVLRRRIARLTESDQSDLLRYTGVLGGELDRVTRRIELLLRLLRPERGAEPTTLAEAIEEMLDLVELERERHGVSIDFHPAPQPVRGHLPREQARQLALNLLFEALDSSPPGGTLTIRTSTENGRTILQVEMKPAAHDPGPAGTGAESPRLVAARALVQALSGDLEVNGDGPSSPEGIGYTVSLPVVAH